jgi:hypothetical protein
MNNLEDTFAVHTATLIRPNTITDKFDNEVNYSAGIILTCMLAPRSNVDESDTVFFDDLGATIKQQTTIFIYKREAIAKGLYTAANELQISIGDKFVIQGELHYINQLSPVGFFQQGAELIKIRVTRQVD